MSSSVIEEIKNRLDVIEVVQSYVRLQKAGANFRANCPFHSEKTPSFMVSPSKQIWHCFGCGKGGDIFKFVMEIERIEFPEALGLLAERAGVKLTREDPAVSSQKSRLYQICEEAAKFFEENLAHRPDAKNYLRERGLKNETIKEFRIGFAPPDWDSLLKRLSEIGYKKEDIVSAGVVFQSSKTPGRYFDRFRSRIMFPLFDANGKVVGFSGRIFPASAEKNSKEGKYVNTPSTPIYDKSRLLYGLHRAKNAIRKENKCVVAEGQMDLIMSHQAGVDICVASSGTAFTPFQMNALRRLCSDFYASFDSDEAGFNATAKSIGLALENDFNVKVIVLSSGKDPADFIKEFGGKAWQEAVENAKPIMEYYFDAAFKKFGAGTIDGKKEISAFLLPKIAALPNEIEKAEWVGRLAAKMKTREESLWLELKKINPNAAEKKYGEPREEQKIKPREEILEERLLGFLLIHPEHSQVVRAFDSKEAVRAEEESDIIFSSDDRLKIFKIFREHSSNFNLDNFLGKIGDDLAVKAKQYVFAAEQSKETAEINPPEEIRYCAAEIMRARYKNILAELSALIENAERAGKDGEIQPLFQKFHDYSRRLNEL